MTNKDDGGPAFPADDTNFGHTVHSSTGMASPGMTLRDFFAAKAVAALIAEPMWNERQVALVLEIGGKALAGAELYASAAYALADAMIEARKK